MEDQPPEEPPKKGHFHGKWKRGHSLWQYQLKGNQKSSGRPSLDTRSPNIVQSWPGYSWKGDGGRVHHHQRQRAICCPQESKQGTNRKYMSENQIITNRHYYAHFLLFLRAPKNSADRHSWMTLQCRPTALFVSRLCTIFKYVLHDYC
jgi:hypothetical protein